MQLSFAHPTHLPGLLDHRPLSTPKTKIINPALRASLSAPRWHTLSQSAVQCMVWGQAELRLGACQRLTAHTRGV
eukprot:2981638-Rhodomonas_salina.1